MTNLFVVVPDMRFIFAAFLIAFGLSPAVLAVDIAKWPASKNVNDPRSIYKRDVIKMALEKTVPSHGAYKLEDIDMQERMNNVRARDMVRSGDVINLYIALTNMDWEKETIPIRIPIRRGILNYRLLLVHTDNLYEFSRVTSLEDLKRKEIGLQLGWTTTKILEAANFNVVKGPKYKSMFYMLDGKRFEYLPRGVNEVFREAQERQNEMSIAVEPTVAMYLPSPTYIFVSPNARPLANRIEAGLEIMVADGTLKEMFNRRFAAALKQANLADRKLIHVPNALLPPETPLHRKELWYQAGESLE